MPQDDKVNGFHSEGEICGLATQGPKGFSLVELLVVIAISILLMVLIAPAISSVMNSQRITDTGSRLAALIERGRMHATVQHRIVGVRFFQTTNSAGFTAADLVELIPDPAAPETFVTNAITRLVRFPEPIILSPSHSSLLAPGSSAGSGSANIPGEGTLSYRDFLIFPDGSTSLTNFPTTNPYLGVLTRPDASGDLKNPLVLSLDPLTCRISIYRK